MNLSKKELLLIIAAASTYLYFYGTNDIPYPEYLDKLPLIGSLAYAFGTMSNLAK